MVLTSEVNKTYVMQNPKSPIAGDLSKTAASFTAGSFNNSSNHIDGQR